MGSPADASDSSVTEQTSRKRPYRPRTRTGCITCKFVASIPVSNKQKMGANSITYTIKELGKFDVMKLSLLVTNAPLLAENVMDTKCPTPQDLHQL